MRQTTRLVFAFLLAFGLLDVRGAKAPLSEEELVRQAEVIVVGKVKGVRSKTQKSEIETGWGFHRDRAYTITLEITEVLKGNGLKQGKELEVRAWQPIRRIPPLPGLQGHDFIPSRGDEITCYLAKNSAGDFAPLLPNGLARLGSSLEDAAR